jgi:hypothetical protein
VTTLGRAPLARGKYCGKVSPIRRLLEELATAAPATWSRVALFGDTVLPNARTTWRGRGAVRQNRSGVPSPIMRLPMGTVAPSCTEG